MAFDDYVHLLVIYPAKQHKHRLDLFYVRGHLCAKCIAPHIHIQIIRRPYMIYILEDKRMEANTSRGLSEVGKKEKMMEESSKDEVGLD